MEVSCRFRRGCNVEVRSEDKDSKGAWYPATILEPPANQRKRSKVLVQYNTMLDEEDPTKLLVEHTTLSLIRPKPPADNAETRFERNDVVDAFHNDMWWPGLVINIVGDKYTVGFKEPPDLLELGRNVLRSHWDWADGVWTRAPKEVMKVSDWKPATHVEVNLNRFELRSSWLPAILLVQLGDNSFLVRYRYKTTDNDSEYDVKAVVSEHQIRPRPPPQEDKIFGLGDMVDAYFDMGWWVSDVTKVLVKKKKYVVKFRITGEEKEFSHSELRCHLEWVCKQWKKFQDCQDNKDDGRRLKQSRKRSNYYAENTKFRGKQLSPCIKKLSLQHNGDPTFSSPNPYKKLKGGSSKDSSLARIYKRKTPVKTSNGDDKQKIEQQHNRQLDSQAISDGEWNTYKRKRFREPKSQEINQHDDDVLRHGIKAKRKLPEIFVEHPEGPTTGYPAGTTNHQVAGLSATAKTGFNEIPLSLRIVGMHSEKSSDFPTRDGKGKASSVEVQVDGTGVSTMAPSQDQSFSSCIDGMDSENTMKGSSDPDGTCNEQNLVAEAGIVTMLPVHDQPLTLCTVNDQPPLPLSIVNDHPLPLGIVNSGNTIEGSSNSAGTAKKQCEVRGRQVENGFTVDTEREETPRLPFVQTSHFWKIFESMDEFKRYPQQPHFKPLQNLKMIKREAKALQCMHLFSSMVKCTSKLQVNDRSGTDDILETLAELEQQGFKVKALENHLNQLKGMQLRFEDLQNQSNVVEMQINKYEHEITEQDKEISDLNEQIRELISLRGQFLAIKSKYYRRRHSEHPA